MVLGGRRGRPCAVRPTERRVADARALIWYPLPTRWRPLHANPNRFFARNPLQARRGTLLLYSNRHHIRTPAIGPLTLGEARKLTRLSVEALARAFMMRRIRSNVRRQNAESGLNALMRHGSDGDSRIAPAISRSSAWTTACTITSLRSAPCHAPWLCDEWKGMQRDSSATIDALEFIRLASPPIGRSPSRH